MEEAVRTSNQRTTARKDYLSVQAVAGSTQAGGIETPKESFGRLAPFPSILKPFWRSASHIQSFLQQNVSPVGSGTTEATAQTYLPQRLSFSYGLPQSSSVLHSVVQIDSSLVR